MALLAALACGQAAAAWQTVASAHGERVDIDKTRIARVGVGKTMAWTRLVLGREVAIAGGKEGYSTVEALNRYDCEKHRFATVKRVYLSEGRLVREEPVESPKEMNAAAGSVDEKLLEEACKPRTVGEMRKVAEMAGKLAAEAQSHALKTPEPPAKVMYADMLSLAKEQPPALRSAADAAPAQRRPTVQAPTRYTRHRPKRVVKAATLPPAPAAPFANIPWGYEGAGGPANWGKLRPDYATCAAGERQSPIDIQDGIRVDQEPIKFDYKSSLFRIVDTGHTIEVDVGPGSTINVMGRRYELTHIDFHRPSEERVNGRGYPMVVHLTHRDEDGHVAVLAVLLERGVANPLIQTFWNNLPLEVGQDLAPSTAIDLTKLLPEQRGYYAYMGSLTTPPCTEQVLWLVMKQPVQVSAEQVAIFSRLYPHNARPLQATNNRLIKESLAP
ncbi:MAG TPA: carbonic anhydrase family protein [Rhodocyclaceae bacterium]|nr:carbonic anhydrase family protein [Rhodocyclaceae bacterium]